MIAYSHDRDIALVPITFVKGPGLRPRLPRHSAISITCQALTCASRTSFHPPRDVMAWRAGPPSFEHDLTPSLVERAIRPAMGEVDVSFHLRCVWHALRCARCHCASPRSGRI